MQTPFPYSIHNLGDDALLIDFGNQIDLNLNAYVVQLHEAVTQGAIAPVKEVVAAYASLAVYYDIAEAVCLKGCAPSGQAYVQAAIEDIIDNFQPSGISYDRKLIRIPVCYDTAYAPDLAGLARSSGLSQEEVIERHTANIYHIYMIGFLPGFAYMGEVDERIATARKPQPTVVQPGSVGIAGRQTGIYPLASPGGWHIIGRTPAPMLQFDKEPPCLYKTGDRVQFYAITPDEFDRY